MSNELVAIPLPRLAVRKEPVPPEKTPSQWQALARCSVPEARERVPFEVARKMCVLPLSLMRDAGGAETLLVMFGGSAAENVTRMRELRFLIGLDVIPDFAPRGEIQRAIIAAYRGLSAAVALIEENAEPAGEKEIAVNIADEKPVPRLLSSILDTAITENASDIHFEPREDKVVVRLRIDGRLEEFPGLTLAPALGQALARRLKVLAKLDHTKIHAAQEGQFHYKNDAWSLAIRFSTIPTPRGERIVLRILSNTFLDDVSGETLERRAMLRRIGLTEDQEQLFRAALGGDGGAIVLSGPTGSGKSTLLAAAILQLNLDERSVVTIEDPIERTLPGVTQIEVDREHELDYNNLLPPLLRQDPDVIVLGEIRNNASAVTALSAAVTGHLMLTTVHAGNCLEIFLRLTQLGVSRELLALSLRLLVSQRLIPRNCPECSEEVISSPMLRDCIDLPSETTLIEGRGCALCRESGTRGRIGVFELLPIGRTLRDRLLAGPTLENKNSEQELRDAAFMSGYHPLAMRVRELLLAGEISPRAALRAVGIAPELFGYI